MPIAPSSLIVPPVSIERNDAFNDENAFLWFDVGDYSSSDRFHNEGMDHCGILFSIS